MHKRVRIFKKAKLPLLLADDDPDDRDLFEVALSYPDPAASIVSFRERVELIRNLTAVIRLRHDRSRFTHAQKEWSGDASRR
ncbi:MAG: hypothetical protein ABIS36_06940 [Chryseolinea sp.]